MKNVKPIELSNGQVVSYNAETEEGYDKVFEFYRPKIKTMVRGWKGVPHYDEDDLFQICSVKLSEALKKFDGRKKIKFSTFVYTIWHRKLAQLCLKYKSKKYSAFIKNDNYIHFNYPRDKATGCQLLRLSQNKCPVNRKVLTKSICSGCEFNKGFVNREITKGKLAGKTKEFSKCDYFKTIIEQRGTKTLSLDYTHGDSSTGLRQKSSFGEFVTCSKQEDIVKNMEYQIDIASIKSKLTEIEYRIIELLYQGWNKTHIIKVTKLTPIKLEKILKQLSDNAHVRLVLGKE
jgi:RNA polymerase sigma factor (sigma-70 family)